MCWSYVVPQLLFAPEWLITQIARGFNCCVDITIVVIEKGFTRKLLSTKVAHKFRTHFSEICFVLLLLGWLAVTDWPVITVGFGFEKPENCSQNGSENPPHAAHFFWPKIHGVPGSSLPLCTFVFLNLCIFWQPGKSWPWSLPTSSLTHLNLDLKALEDLANYNNQIQNSFV